MENELLIWQVAALALAAGVLIGVLAYRLFAPSLRQADKVQTDLEQTREELAEYRASVDVHFNKTSELVNDLTQNYVKVYQHLAEGVQTLGNNRSFNNLLEQQQGKVVLSVDDQTEPADGSADAVPVEPAQADEPPVSEPVDFVVDGATAEAKPAGPVPGEPATDAAVAAPTADAADADTEKKPAAAETTAETTAETADEAVTAKAEPVKPVRDKSDPQ